MAAYRAMESASQSQQALEIGAFQTRRMGRCCDGCDFVAIAIIPSLMYKKEDLRGHSRAPCTPYPKRYFARRRRISSVEPKKAVGCTRMAAPVGQAWTQRSEERRVGK